MSRAFLKSSCSTVACICRHRCWPGQYITKNWTIQISPKFLSRAALKQNDSSLLQFVNPRQSSLVAWATRQPSGLSGDIEPNDKETSQVDELAGLSETYNEEEDADFDEFFEDAAGEAEEEPMGPAMVTGGAPWSEQALAVAEKLLSSTAELAGIKLYSFRAQLVRKHLDIRLDKLDDYYGSPTLDEIERFCRLYSAALEQAMGAELAGSIDYEVSSPGAERQLRLPEDLERFGDLAMKVVYEAEAGKTDVKIFDFIEIEEADSADGSSSSNSVTVWRLADVRANAPVKGRKLSKKQREQGFRIKLSDIKQVNLYIDY